MNTIYETTTNETQTIQNSNDNGSSISTTTVTTSSTNGQESFSTANGSSVTSVKSDTTSISSEEFCDNLKIINHLKNIEKINEKRRVFLTNTINEYSIDEKIESDTKNGFNGHNAANNNQDKADILTTDSDTRIEANHFQRMHAKIESFDSVSDIELTFVPPPFTKPTKSPSSPPPKPPMLSRNRSIGNSSDRSSPQSPLFQSSGFKTPNGMETPRSPVFQGPLLSSAKAEQTSRVSATKTVQIPATNSPENGVLIVETTKDDSSDIAAKPLSAVKVQLTETAVLRKAERPQSLLPATATLRSISENHYERLVEELKCPGCASPMKGPVYLCQSGHSVCAQCTRVLLMCPLCKDPFTLTRSLTIEALCSKAHFRCSNAEGGCTVRLQLDLLGWHEKNCIYKPMQCFMGRIWGGCKWTGREINWKDHVESAHADKVFNETTAVLTWNLGLRQKLLTSYYVFVVFDEMFNFYEVNDNDRVLFTMTCTSAVREKINHFAFEVTVFRQDDEAFSITQKYPVHSEYDIDILKDGTCVSIPLNDLAKFIDQDRLLHYRVSVVEINSPRKSKSKPCNKSLHPIDFKSTQIEGGNLKNIPSDAILTRSTEEELYKSGGEPETPSMEVEYEVMRRQYDNNFKNCKKNSDETDSDPELEAFVAKKWGTPQLNFNRKYLGNISSDTTSSADDTSNMSKNRNKLSTLERRMINDVDKTSISSAASTSYRKRMTNTLRKSFRTIKSEVIDLKPFGKKTSPDKKISPEKKPSWT